MRTWSSRRLLAPRKLLLAPAKKGDSVRRSRATTSPFALPYLHALVTLPSGCRGVAVGLKEREKESTNEGQEY